MTGLVHWRKMTGALVLWSGYVVAWMVIAGSGVEIAALWWLAGMMVFGSLWLAAQPSFQQGRSLDGLFVQLGWTNWRVVNVHRGHRDTKQGRDAR